MKDGGWRMEDARIAQSVEHILGKDEVTGSIPVACLGCRGGMGDVRHERAPGDQLGALFFIRAARFPCALCASVVKAVRL